MLPLRHGRDEACLGFERRSSRVFVGAFIAVLPAGGLNAKLSLCSLTLTSGSGLPLVSALASGTTGAGDQRGKIPGGRVDLAERSADRGVVVVDV